MAEYQKGEMVDFFRNVELQENNVPVIAIVPLAPDDHTGLPPVQNYIIENAMGWFPSLARQIQYDLDPDTKYLFVLESELDEAN